MGKHTPRAGSTREGARGVEQENQDGVPMKESSSPSNRKNLIHPCSLPLFSASAPDVSVLGQVTDVSVPPNQEGSVLEGHFLL